MYIINNKYSSHKILWEFFIERRIIIKSILTNRERAIFNLLIENKSTKEIAEELSISEKTVRNHISNTMQKLGVKGRSGAVVELIKLKELSI